MTYGCHNRPRPGEYYFAPDGHATTGSVKGRTPTSRPGTVRIVAQTQARVVRLVRNPFAGAPCKYDMSTTDPKCQGCQHVAPSAQ